MGSWTPRCRKPWFYCMKRKVPRIRVMGSCAALPCPARPCSILLRLGSHLGLPGDIGGINLIDLSQQMLCSSESTCIKGQTGQSVSLSKRFLKGPGDSWEPRCPCPALSGGLLGAPVSLPCLVCLCIRYSSARFEHRSEPGRGGGVGWLLFLFSV